MDQLNTTELINIGGVGSCKLSDVLRKLNYPCYIFDWNATYQSAVIESILNLKHLYKLENKSFFRTSDINAIIDRPVCVNNSIVNETKTFWDIHSFTGNYNECESINKKYIRRLDRLKNVLQSNKKKVLIRMAHTLDSEHPEINFNKEKDNKEKWKDFYKTLSNKYNNIHLLVLYNGDPNNGPSHEQIENITFINDKELFNNNDAMYNYLKFVKMN